MTGVPRPPRTREQLFDIQAMFMLVLWVFAHTILLHLSGCILITDPDSYESDVFRGDASVDADAASDAPDDAPSDVVVLPDAPSPDVPQLDSGPVVDGGLPDTGPPDTSAPDARPPALDPELELEAGPMCEAPSFPGPGGCMCGFGAGLVFGGRCMAPGRTGRTQGATCTVGDYNCAAPFTCFRDECQRICTAIGSQGACSPGYTCTDVGHSTHGVCAR